MQENKDLEHTTPLSQLIMPNLQTPIDFLKQHRLKCIANNTALQMCINPGCKNSNVFQCFKENCQCQQIHDGCSQGKSRRVIAMVTTKIAKVESFIQFINSIIDKKIDQLSDLRETLIKTVENELKYIDLSRLEKKFLKLVRGDGKVEEFTSIESRRIWQLSKQVQTESSKTSTKINPIFKSFDNNISKNIAQSITRLRTSIEKMADEKRKDQQRQLEQFGLINSIEHLKFAQNNEKFNSLQLPKIKKTISMNILQLEIIQKSAICTTEQLSSKLIRIFDKDISKLSYLFRASENEFSIDKYFEVCGKVDNTVVISKTNMNNIIGAYTPLPHDHNNYDNYVEDASGESFIFSLTDQEKFALKNKAEAIYRHEDRNRICFGSAQFMIDDKSNTSKNCCSEVNCSSYYCPAYSINDKAAWLKFNGNQSKAFSTKEWQVWRVEF